MRIRLRPCVFDVRLELSGEFFFVLLKSASSTSQLTPPRFVVEPQSGIVRPGASITLTCAVQPEATGVSIRWTFNGTTVTSSSTGRRRGGGLGGIDVRDGTLRIVSYSGSSQQQSEGGNTTTSHDGVYQCVASSASGTIVSTEATLETACKVQRPCAPLRSLFARS